MTITGLQCPTCGHIHPLAKVPGEGRFRCTGCNRLLSVPAAMEAPALPDPDATRAHSAATPHHRPPARDGRRSTATSGGSTLGAPGQVPPGAQPVSAWVRAPVWVLALGVGFVIAAAVLRAVGLLDLDTILDAFAGDGVGRYAVLLVFLPLWALLSAGAAHLVLEWAGRRRERRGRRDTPKPPGDAGKGEKATVKEVRRSQAPRRLGRAATP